MNIKYHTNGRDLVVATAKVEDQYLRAEARCAHGNVFDLEAGKRVAERRLRKLAMLSLKRDMEALACIEQGLVDQYAEKKKLYDRIGSALV